MPIDGLNNKQIEKLIRNDVTNIKKSFSNKNNSYDVSSKNLSLKISTWKQMNKIVLN
jgi:hypothetical protein